MQGTLIVILTAIFGGDPSRPRALALLILPHAIATAVFAPLAFRMAEWAHNATAALPRPGEAGQS